MEEKPGLLGDINAIRNNKKMKRIYFAKLLLILVLLVPETKGLPFHAENQQAVASGNVFSMGQYGPYPLAGIAVTLNHPNLGRSSPYYTNRQGYFFFQNVPPGNYNLEFWLNPNMPVIRNVQLVYNQYGQSNLGSWQIP